MDESKLIELLAEAEHKGWSRWMKYVFSQCTRNLDGSATIPPELVAGWTRQLSTPYDKLTEEEREADRDEVRKILPIIRDY